MQNLNQPLNIGYDLGILALFDTNPINYVVNPTEDNNIEKNLHDHAIKNFRILVQKLFSIKAQKDENFENEHDDLKIYDFSKSEYDITLPESTTVFPRHKRLPDEKHLTRWEKFAKEKGIKKQKRSRKIYDEITKTWVPRWGARSIKKIQDKVDIIRESKPGDDINADPFDKKSLEKSLTKEKQKFREMRNKMEGNGLSGKNIPKSISNGSKTKNDKKKKHNTLEIAQKSTASMGLFDKKAHKEEPEIIKKRRNNVKPFKSLNEEKKRNLEILEYVAKTGKTKRA